MARSIAQLLENEFSDSNDPIRLWIAFVVLNIADYISTAINVGIYGPSVEMNPVIRPLIEAYGPHSILLWKTVWIVPVVYVGLRWLGYHAALVLNFTLLAVVYGNVFLK